MGQLSKVLRNVAGGGLTFWCPGCKEAHTVWHGEGPGPRWAWNGDVDKPVFSPSVLVTGVDLTPESIERIDRGDRLPAGETWPCNPVRCHTFVGCNGAAPGQIIYLGDCTHELAGKTIDLPPMPPYRSTEV